MRAVFALVLVAGLGLAGFAVYMAQGYFQQQRLELQTQQAEMAKIVPTVAVLAVKHAMPYGAPITPDDVEVIRYAQPFLPDGVFRTREELFPKGPDVSRVVLRPMEAKEPVLAVKVTEPGADAGITGRLSRGMRAFAIRVDAASGVSGFVRPGDKVDVYWSGTAGRNDLGGSGVTKLIESGIKVVAVDQTSDVSNSTASIARTVTVEVSPQQVASLAQAQTTGTLALSLVGNADDTVAQAVEVDQAKLLGLQAPQAVAAAPAAKVCTIRTRKGSDVVELPIPCPTN